MRCLFLQSHQGYSLTRPFELHGEIIDGFHIEDSGLPLPSFSLAGCQLGSSFDKDVIARLIACIRPADRLEDITAEQEAAETGAKLTVMLHVHPYFPVSTIGCLP